MEINKEQNTEQIILEAAEKLFLDKGFAMTTTTEIAHVAGCNQALVHYYFRTKEKLFSAVFEKKMKLFLSTILQVTVEGLSFEEKLTRKIELHFDMIKANPKLPFLIMNELTTNPTRLLALKNSISELPKSVFQQIQKELSIEIEAGNIRAITLMDLIITIISLNVGLFLAHPILRVIVDTSDEDFEKIVEKRKKENVRIILNSLKP